MSMNELNGTNILNILFAVIWHGYKGISIRCFECNSNQDPKCADDIPPAYLSVDCTTMSAQKGVKHTLCRKIKQDIEFDINSCKFSWIQCNSIEWCLKYSEYFIFSSATVKKESRIIRSCGWIDSKWTNSCYAKGGLGGRQEICSCTKDFCNDASISAINWISVILVPIATILIIRIQN